MAAAGLSNFVERTRLKLLIDSATGTGDDPTPSEWRLARWLLSRGPQPPATQVSALLGAPGVPTRPPSALGADQKLLEIGRQPAGSRLAACRRRLPPLTLGNRRPPALAPCHAVYQLDELVQALAAGDTRAGVDAISARLAHRSPVVKLKVGSDGSRWGVQRRPRWGAPQHTEK